jgi:hypothetical protein
MNASLQLSLYDVSPAVLHHVQVDPNKRPWEMSEEEYEAWEETILYHQRPSVSGRDNPFQDWLSGQEASVFLALEAGESVAPDVLARFAELKEWHETGSSPTIRQHEEDDRRRHQEIENRPPVGTEEIYEEEGRVDRRVIYVEPTRLQHDYESHRKNGDINASYSGDLISNPRSTVRRPFQFENNRYVSTGSGPLLHSVSAYQLVPSTAYTGEAMTYTEKVSNNPKDAECKYSGDTARNDPLGFYHGMLVTSAGKPHVMVGPSIIFRPAKAGSALFRTQTQ